MKKLLNAGLFIGMALVLLRCAAGNQAQQSYKSKNYHQTLTLTKQAILKDSTDTGSMILMAKAYIELDSLSEADAVLQRSLKMGLDDPRQKQDASDCYFKLGEYADKNRDIMRYLKTAENLSPQSKEVLERLAKLYEKAGELEEANVRYEKLVMIVDDPTQYGFMTNALTNKIEFAREAFDEGMHSYKKKKYGEASKYFSKAVEAYPGLNEAVYFLNLSKVKLIKRNPNKTARNQARVYLTVASEAEPKKAEPHFLMGQFFEMENDKNYLDEAIHHYAISYRLEPKGPLARKSDSKVKSLKKKKATLDKFWGD